MAIVPQSTKKKAGLTVARLYRLYDVSGGAVCIRRSFRRGYDFFSKHNFHFILFNRYGSKTVELSGENKKKWDHKDTRTTHTWVQVVELLLQV